MRNRGCRCGRYTFLERMNMCNHDDDYGFIKESDEVECHANDELFKNSSLDNRMLYFLTNDNRSYFDFWMKS